MTLLKFVNMFLFQWFFIRLAKEVDQITYKKTIAWGLLCGVVPCTGWSTDYKFFPGNKTYYLTLWKVGKSGG
ncbi:hypothetical protein LCGC14_2107580 [marine sediment metagenome]|uniref:Uncharacterized protein n=1 Tax=marine sediment metagenome TaxID=412755 RepID=A0A0F9GL80_9ZZZZ